MSHPVTRVLTLLELLQARPGLTGAELAARLGVDERTVRRYAVRLNDLGVPVEAGRGRHGGYRLLPGYKLPPLMLTDDEATALVLGLLSGRRTGLTAGEAATESALAKLQRVMPPALRARVQAVSETVGFTGAPGRRDAAPETGHLLSLADAVRGHRRVRLDYRSYAGDPSTREVDPFGLVFHGGRWYLTGHDHSRGEMRTFRVDRVVALACTGEEFTGPGDFDAVAHVVRSLSSVPCRYRVEVVLHTTYAEARRRIPATIATLTETGDGVTMRLGAESLPGTAQMLAGLGWPFTVITPDDLRRELRALATRLQTYAEYGKAPQPA
ncbi:helix-turn-helix transcriptional regulator [Sinosporangium siamense]|uniref:Transcriptional regulator n=1 Tax=Sinosporangium siamense TaxID=1367973 RepID=A0A919RPN3_9ACTN|nr:YafY family protein [Sinosporangium siamense]GII97433.1 transcriptional regulator [Sinosporangium siamense]